MTSEEQPTRLQEMINRYGLPVMIILMVVGIMMICVFGILLLRSFNVDEVAEEPEGTPTPFAVGPDGVPELDQDVVVVGINESGTISVTLDAPVSLRVADRTYTVQTQVLGADGIWTPTGVGEGTAVWVYGSIINYVLGIPDAGENEALLEQLVPGDEMQLTTRSGTQHTFIFDSRQLLPANSRDAFAQTAPGLTLALLQGDAAERLVVHGTYLVPETIEGDSGSTIFELGETAQFGNVQVTVNGATYLPDRPELPAGFAFFLVDFQVQNIGLSALNSSNLTFSLVDELGNRYAQSGVASQLGSYPPLTGFLNANQLLDATIGFQVPRGLASPTLNLVISRSGAPEQITFNLPFPGGAQAAQGASISLQNVEVSADRTSLILSGQVTNLGEQPLAVAEQDVTLKTDDGASYLLLSTNPPFPWSVGPGQAVTFVVTYQRPLTADAAIFTILSQPFQLSGLR